MHRRRLTASILLGALAPACTSRPAPEAESKARASAQPEAVHSPVTKQNAESLALVDRLSRCDVNPGGVFVDLGSPGAQGVVGGWSLSPDDGTTDVERDGETWARIFGRKLVWRFVLDEAAPLSVSMRARGIAARAAVVSLDTKPLGTLFLTRNQTRVIGTHPTAGLVSPGAHVVEIRFPGARAPTEAAAEIDWIRAGSGEQEGTFAPPTTGQIVSNAALSGVPHRAVALRAPASLRCTALLTPGSRLELALGFEGPGRGEAEMLALRDGEPPSLLDRAEVEGGDHAQWKPASLALSDVGGKPATIELRAKSSSQGGRLLFGDPVVRVNAAPLPAVPAARLVVVVVLSGVDRTKFTNAEQYPAVAELARTGITFLAHRAPTTVTASVMASLITGKSPEAHGVEDAEAKVPTALTTLGGAAGEGSVQTAMFTGCPTTFEPFGFARGWDKYATFSPIEGVPSVAPIAEAAQWTVAHMKADHAKALVVVHARGGHPPWDVTLSEAAKLAPFDYSGSMEPRRAGQLIARARGKHSRYRLSDGDRVRMWALYELALAGQDRAIGSFVDALKHAALWDQTLFVVTGDVSTAADSRAPFGDGEDLSEELLALPLWVHFPGGTLAGARVDVPTTMVDISRSALQALRLPIPEAFEGLDLLAVGAGAVPVGGRPLFATLGPRYSLRLGDFVLSGSDGKPPALCDTKADPVCDADRAEKMPRTAAHMFRMAYDARVAAAAQRRPREAAVVDANTAAALQVWGE
jgi:arylsulfatase A-like enzyme